VVATDLLTGVLVGLAMSLLELVPYRRNLKLKVDESHDEHESHVALEGTATFLSLTKLTGALERLPANRPVRLDLDGLKGMDHTTAETMSEWLARRRKTGAPVHVEGSEDIRRLIAAAA
jgi:MFS superfamily sulfate permease-like transporter